MSLSKIVLISTQGMIALVANTLSSMRNCQIEMSDVLLIVPGSEISAFMDLEKEYRCELRPFEAFVENGHLQGLGSDYAQYGTAAFSDIGSMRGLILRRLLNQYEIVIHPDVDIVWLRNPMAYLRQVLAQHPVAMQTEATDQFPPPFCMGFMAFRAGAPALAVLDWFQTAFDADRKSDPTATMQVTFNRLLKAEPDRAGEIFPLPESLFPNGRLYRLFAAENARHDLAPAPEPFLFHANWTIGLEAKMQMLRLCGLWAAGNAQETKLVHKDLQHLQTALQRETQRNAQLTDEIEAGQRKILIYDTELKQRTAQSEQLLADIASAYAELDAGRKKIIEYDALLRERTNQSAQLLSHVEAAYAELDQLKSAARPPASPPEG